MLRVIDGDTFVARVHVWPGIDITTKVRLRGIDAPELRARCEDERMRALAARDGLTQILEEGEVGISRVGQDKYGGRVDAAVSTAVDARRVGGAARARSRAALRRPARELVRSEPVIADRALARPGMTASSYCSTITRVPTCARRYKSMMSALYMRMQPCETNLPTEPGLLVPWMA